MCFFVCLFIYLFVFVSLFVCLFIYSFIRLFIYFISRSFETIMHHRRTQAVFPLPHRRIDRRSLNVTYADLPKIRKPGILKHPSLQKRTKTWDWDKYNLKHDMLINNKVSPVEDENLRFDQKYSQKRSLVARMNLELSEDNDDPVDELDTTALQERVTKINKKGKYKFISDWLDRLHFVTIPLYEVGNWLPLVMSRWYCSGHGCGLDQVSVEKKQGNIKFSNISFRMLSLLLLYAHLFKHL